MALAAVAVTSPLFSMDVAPPPEPVLLMKMAPPSVPPPALSPAALMTAAFLIAAAPLPPLYRNAMPLPPVAVAVMFPPARLSTSASPKAL